jgi:hypothetical protein
MSAARHSYHPPSPRDSSLGIQQSTPAPTARSQIRRSSTPRAFNGEHRVAGKASFSSTDSAHPERSFSQFQPTSGGKHVLSATQGVRRLAYGPGLIIPDNSSRAPVAYQLASTVIMRRFQAMPLKKKLNRSTRGPSRRICDQLPRLRVVSRRQPTSGHPTSTPHTLVVHRHQYRASRSMYFSPLAPVRSVPSDLVLLRSVAVSDRSLGHLCQRMTDAQPCPDHLSNTGQFHTRRRYVFRGTQH